MSEDLARVMEPPKINAKTKEVVAFAVTAINGRDFCLNAPAAACSVTGTTTKRLLRSSGPLLWHRGSRTHACCLVLWE